MKEKLFLALRDGIASVSLDGTMLHQAHPGGVCAICAGKQSLFCAEHSGAIWRLDRQTLLPCSLGCGGPGICSMCLSSCERKLYALLGEADSVLMSEAQSGRPLAVNRCGCDPKGFALCGNTLVVAGGESGRVHLFCDHTLDCLGEVLMPGPVYSAAICDGTVYALCIAPDMNAWLIATEGGKRSMLCLAGMPGCLYIDGERIYAATQGFVYVFSRKGIRQLARRAAPGRADRMFIGRDYMILCDPLSECVFVSHRGGAWKRLCCGVQDVCVE